MLFDQHVSEAKVQENLPTHAVKILTQKNKGSFLVIIQICTSCKLEFFMRQFVNI